ncbi:MAG TPA: porin [Pyrinomonadaceae bacterium]|nr:porin [Pyrinomonadaceae bacterium]
MKMVKSLVLGSAAGLIAMSGAQAADLPVKAKAVEYVRICSLYGAGFFYIPGTDTCIKLGGYLRVDTTFHGGIYDAPFWSGDGGQGNRFADQINSRSRMALTVDTRTATEYGVVRTFGQADFQFSTYGGTTNNAALNASALVGGLNNDTPGNGYVAVEMAYIQFAGFTLGKSASADALPWNGYGGNNNTSFLMGGPDYVTGVNNIQYTAQFGGGMSATIGLDEGKVFNRTALGNLDISTFGANYPTSNATLATATSLLQGGYGLGAAQGSVLNRGTGGPVNGYGGQIAPDIAANIKVDQAWGIFQISGIAHLVNASYNQLDSATNAGAQGFTSPYPASYAVCPAYGANGTGSGPGQIQNGTGQPCSSVTSGHPNSKWGGAITAGLQLKQLWTGAGDILNLDATYASGDTKAVISTSAASPNFVMFNHIGTPGATGALGYVSDGVFGNGVGPNGPTAGTGGVIQLTNAYGFRGGFIHNWDPYWQSSIFGSASYVRYNSTAKTGLCNSASSNAATGFGFTGTAITATCNPDFDVYMVGFRTGWTPVKNLTFSAEVLYAELDQKNVGTTGPLFAVTGPLAQQRYTFGNQSTVSFNVRAQRNF